MVLSTPTLNLPDYVPLNAVISAGYTGTAPVSYFQWTFTPVTSIPASSPAGNRILTAGAAPAASFNTPSATANLSSVVLGLGPYLITLRAYDTNNTPSGPAQEYVTMVAADLAGVRVYPNPWRSDKHSGRPLITFDNLTVNSTIKIFTVSGHLVKTLPMASNSVTWDLTNESGDKVASGTYIYLIKDDQGQKKTGKVAVIK